MRLSIYSVLFILLSYFSDGIVDTVLKIGGTPYHWIMDSDLPVLSFADFNSVMLAIISVCANGAVALIALIVVLVLAWNYLKLLLEAAERYVLLGVLVWFLCAIAFLKVSQKIDSFMSSLGINVGHTGGSLIVEALVTARGVGAVRGFSRQYFGGGHSSSSSHVNTGSDSSGSPGRFMAGGLAGVVSRQVTNNAIRTATASTVTEKSSGKEPSGFASAVSAGIGGNMYASSVIKGGDFANSAIGTVATGNIASVGSMTGEKAAQALHSYMGYAIASTLIPLVSPIFSLYAK